MNRKRPERRASALARRTADLQKWNTKLTKVNVEGAVTKNHESKEEIQAKIDIAQTDIDNLRKKGVRLDGEKRHDSTNVG